VAHLPASAEALTSSRGRRRETTTFPPEEQGYHSHYVDPDTSPSSAVRADNVCAVCGSVANDADLEDTNGWRWFNDGKGGLLPLCATCPAPPALLDPAPEQSRVTA
jgi:hypothetical protein